MCAVSAQQGMQCRGSDGRSISVDIYNVVTNGSVEFDGWMG